MVKSVCTRLSEGRCTTRNTAGKCLGVCGTPTVPSPQWQGI